MKALLAAALLVACGCPPDEEPLAEIEPVECRGTDGCPGELKPSPSGVFLVCVCVDNTEFAQATR